MLKTIYLALICLLASATSMAGQLTAETAKTRGRHFAEQLQQQQVKELWLQMTPTMQNALGSEAALNEFSRRIRADLGEPLELLSETVEQNQGFWVYQRYMSFSTTAIPVLTQLAFDQQGKVAGLFVKPQAMSMRPADSAHLNYQTKADMRLPFDDDWFVFWGGRDLKQNYHAANSNQRFAYDFVVHSDGKSHQNDGLQLSDYYCWGKPILSPADAVVVHAVHDLPDQAIGSMDRANPAGNHLILDLGHGEYALLAHFQQNSLRVKANDQVKQGDTLGLCGNSGNTSEPHLHFHLQTGKRFGEGDGLPAQFQDYIANGQAVPRGEPTRGQTVQQTSAP